MKVIGFRVQNLEKDAYYVKHLQIINPFLPKQLTNKKLEVLASFMALEGDIIEDGDRFNTLARKKVKKKHNLSAAGLSNYLDDWREKNLIYDKDGIIMVQDYLFPEKQKQGYNFMIKMKE